MVCSNIVTKSDIVDVRQKFPPGYITPVDIELCKELGDAIGAELYIVRADQSSVLSFKERGAFVKVLEEVEKARSEGRKELHFVAASEGNHSQGVAKAVAYFAKENPDMKITATIYMPELTPEVKKNQTLKVGEGYTNIKPVIQNEAWKDASGLYDDALDMAKTEAEKEGVFLVPTFDGEEIIKGAGTVGIELQESGIDFDEVHLAAGGCGFVAGIAASYSGTNTRVVGNQPSWVPSAVAAVANKGSVRIPEISGEQEIVLGDRTLVHKIHPDGVIIAQAGQIPVNNIIHHKGNIATVTPAQNAFAYSHFINAVCRDGKGRIDYAKAPEVCATLGLANVLREAVKNPGCFEGKKIAVVVSGRNISAAEAYDSYVMGRYVDVYRKQGADKAKEIFDVETPSYSPGERAELKALHSLRGFIPEDTHRNIESNCVAA